MLGTSTVSQSALSLGHKKSPAMQRQLGCVVLLRLRRDANAASDLSASLRSQARNERFCIATRRGPRNVIPEVAPTRAQESRVEADRRWNGSWGRNYLSRCPGRVPKLGKRFFEPMPVQLPDPLTYAFRVIPASVQGPRWAD
jgi:hypothetical protein